MNNLKSEKAAGKCLSHQWDFYKVLASDIQSSKEDYNSFQYMKISYVHYTRSSAGVNWCHSIRITESILRVSQLRIWFIAFSVL